MARVRIALQHLLDLQGQAGNAAPHIGMPPLQRAGIDAHADPHQPAVAKSISMCLTHRAIAHARIGKALETARQDAEAAERRSMNYS